MTYKLAALSGPHEGMIHVLSRRVTTIGRDPRNPIQLFDEQVSREHCQVELQEGFVVIRDLNSTNGTFLNGKRITHAQANLDDEIVVGKTLFKLQAAKEEEHKHGVAERLTLVAEHIESEGEIHIALEKDNGRYSKPGQVHPTPSSWQRILSDLAFLFETAKLLNTAKNLTSLLDTLLEATLKALDPDRAYVFLVDESSHKLMPCATRTRKGKGDPEIRVSRTVMDSVVRNKSSILSTDAMTDKRWNQTDSIAALGLCSTLCAPLLSGEKLIGVFQIDSMRHAKRFEEDDLHLFTALAHQAGPAIENLILIEKERRTFDSFVNALAATIDARDKFTAGHSAKVMETSLGIAEAMGLKDNDVEVLRYAALLHDYGNVAIPESVLSKQDNVSSDEFDQIKEHARWTREILSKVDFPDHLKAIPDVACHHHERMSGGGYPDGLKGEEIPLGSRIIAVADFFDALTSGRSYRDALEPEMAMRIIENSKGNHLDGKVVEAFKTYWSRSQENSEPQNVSGAT